MRLLLVEDDPRVARVVERGLAEAGYDVDVAADGAEGLARAARDGHDLIVLDVMLPVLDGLEVCRALREQGVPTELVVYPREPHSISERAHQLDVLKRVRRWFDRWLRA